MKSRTTRPNFLLWVLVYSVTFRISGAPIWAALAAGCIVVLLLDIAAILDDEAD